MRLLTDPGLDGKKSKKTDDPLMKEGNIRKSDSGFINHMPMKSGYPHPMALLSSAYQTEESTLRKNELARSTSARISCEIPSVQQYSRYSSLRPKAPLRSSNRSLNITYREKSSVGPSTPDSSHNSIGRGSQGSINVSLSQPILYLDDQIKRYKDAMPKEIFNSLVNESEAKYQSQLKRVMSLHKGIDAKTKNAKGKRILLKCEMDK